MNPSSYNDIIDALRQFQQKASQQPFAKTFDLLESEITRYEQLLTADFTAV